MTDTGSPNPPFVIERARFRDLRAVAAIQRASFRPGLAYSWTSLVILWLLPTVHFLIARDTATGQVLGCCLSDHDKGDVRVINIAVAPAARRQGIATALLRRLESDMPEGDLTLTVEEPNTGAQALYEREGFVRTGTARNYYGSGRHGIWMRRRRMDGESGKISV